MIGSVLIATLTTSVITGIEDNPGVPTAVKERATSELVAGVPFISDTQLEDALEDASVPETQAESVVSLNSESRLKALRVAFGLAALLAIVALFFTGGLPRVPVGAPTSGKASGTDSTA